MYGGVLLYGVIIWFVYKGTISFIFIVPLFGYDLFFIIN